MPYIQLIKLFIAKKPSLFCKVDQNLYMIKVLSNIYSQNVDKSFLEPLVSVTRSRERHERGDGHPCSKKLLSTFWLQILERTHDKSLKPAFYGPLIPFKCALSLHFNRQFVFFSSLQYIFTSLACCVVLPPFSTYTQWMHTVRRIRGFHPLKVIAMSLILTLAGVSAHGAPFCSEIFLAQHSAQPLSPSTVFLEQQVSKVIESIDNSNQSKFEIPRDLQLNIRAKRDALTSVLYSLDVVSRTEVGRLLSDKLILAKVLKKYLGEKFFYFHPPTQGLKEFLVLHKFVDLSGKVIATRAQLIEAFNKDFPNGFIVKPTTGWSSSGKTFYIDREVILQLLLKGDSDLYRQKDFNELFQSDLYDAPTSGEKFMLMGLIKGTSVTSKDSTYGEANEFRVHSFYRKIVSGATQTRWYTPFTVEKLNQVETFVQNFLDLMPRGFSHQMAYSFDIFITSEGIPQIIEVNTNRGRQENWSGFLRVPEVVGSYARLLKEDYNWQIQGVEGWMIYNNLANAIPHIKYDFPEWIRDAEVLGKEKEALVGLRQLEADFILKAKQHANNPQFQKSPDFVQLLEFGATFSEKLAAIGSVGDPGWVNFVKWTKTLD
jgi:hypothetical protein